MAHLVGKYQLVKNENLVQYFVSIGFPEENAKQADAARPVLEIAIDGKTVTQKTTSHTGLLVLDQEVDERWGNGVSLKSTAKLVGDTLVVDSKLSTTGQAGSRVYKLSGDELIITMDIFGSSNTAKVYYKKL